MPGRDMIAIGGSAGALVSLKALVERLPRAIPAAFFVALHTSAESTGGLPEILSRSGSLPARFPHEGETIDHGVIYVAPPDQHLLVTDGAVVAVDGPKENGFRPAIDPLFRSLAQAYGSRSVGVILSGALDDGTFGLMSIKEAGGLAIVQHPYEAMQPGMPLSAIEHVEVDYIVRTNEIALHLIDLAGLGPPESPAPPSQNVELLPPTATPQERDITLRSVAPDAIADPPAPLTCPSCGGSLWQIDESKQFRFRCHTGHGFTPQTLLAAQNAQLESALWSAVRSFRERAALHREMGRRAQERQGGSTAEFHERRAGDEEAKAELIRRLLAPHPADTEIPRAAGRT
jgi:two-component system chemotaxis response regulator CheB